MSHVSDAVVSLIRLRSELDQNFYAHGGKQNLQQADEIDRFISYLMNTTFAVDTGKEEQYKRTTQTQDKYSGC
jgi:hypothetical protein